MNRAAPYLVSVGNEAADTVLNALPHPILMVAPDGKIAEANVAAEAFFEVSMLLLRRHQLRDLVPFGSPLLALIDQVRNRGSAVNEYRVDLSTPRNPGERLVDLNVAPVQERPGHVVVMLLDRMEVFADERPVEREPVNIHVVLDRVKKLALSGFGRNIKFVETYDPSLPFVLANRDQFIQVFLNLVKNAA